MASLDWEDTKSLTLRSITRTSGTFDLLVDPILGDVQGGSSDSMTMNAHSSTGSLQVDVEEYKKKLENYKQSTILTCVIPTEAVRRPSGGISNE